MSVTIFDAYGQPVRSQDLTREIAAPSVTGVRRIWDETVASGMTPARLARILQSAAEGDADDFLTLAEEMEEKDLHYACELGKRKMAVSRLDISVESYSDSARDIELADAVRGLMRRYGIRGLIKDLLDSLGKGYSVVEIIWDRSGSRWLPERYEWRDPRFFIVDRPTRREIRLREESDLANGIPLAPYKFIRHIHKMKSGIPLRGGIARLAAWAWMLKNYTVKDWMAFGELFGIPLRIGKYGPGALPEDIAVLKMAVANLGSDAAAVIPQSMEIELVETAKATGGESFYQRMADWFDAQVSRGILGQTATTQGTPGKLGNEEAQAEVREDIRDDDAEQIEETLNRELVKPFIDLNYGPQENYPTVQIRAAKQEDITALSSALKDLVPLGLRVEQSVIRDKMGLPDPDPKAKPEDLLSMAQDRGAGSEERGQALNRESTARNQDLSAEASAKAEGDKDAIDDLVDDSLSDWEPMMQPVIDPIRQAVEASESFEDLQGRFTEIMNAMVPKEIVDALATACLKARALGDATDEV